MALELAVLRDIHKPQQPNETPAYYSARRSNEAIGIGIALRSAFKVMRQALLEDRKVYLPGIGTIERSVLTPRAYRHPKTSEVLMRKARCALRFNTSPNMKSALIEIEPTNVD
jgi:nucleoid DNA-binding protein